MSTRNIGLHIRVYEKLARYKRDSESFSKAIERLLSQAESLHTGADILRRLPGIPPLSPDEADSMLRVVEDDRKSEIWDQSDLS